MAKNLDNLSLKIVQVLSAVPNKRRGLHTAVAMVTRPGTWLLEKKVSMCSGCGNILFTLFSHLIWGTPNVKFDMT